MDHLYIILATIQAKTHKLHIFVRTNPIYGINGGNYGIILVTRKPHF